MFAVDAALDVGDIGFGQAISRVGEAVGKSGIVGEDNQAGGVDVQSADAEDTLPGGDEVDCPGSILRVEVGADDAFWLIEQEVNLWLALDAFVGDGDYVFVSVSEGG